MKFKTTQKAIKEGYKKVISVSYASLQRLLKWHDPIAYTANCYGWRADIYSFGNVAIVTGYSPFGNVKPDYNLIREYEKKAEVIIDEINDYENGYKRQREALDNLIRELIRDVAGIDIAA